MRMLAAALALVLSTCGGSSEITFSDVETHPARLLEWESAIKLPPDQERVKKVALEAIPASCCSNNSAYTCCCPCNMSRSIWGLSAYTIVNQEASALDVREKVQDWQKFIAPDGHSGKTCYTAGGCQRPFSKDGCGGMTPNQVVF